MLVVVRVVGAMFANRTDVVATQLGLKEMLD